MHSEGIKVLNYIGYRPSFCNWDKSNQRQTRQPHQIVHATRVITWINYFYADYLSLNKASRKHI